MAFLNETLWGVRLWIWFYLVFSLSVFIFVVIYFFKERLKKGYYSIKYPEKLLKIVIHYSSNYFKEYWRIIPDNEEFEIEGRLYKYSDKLILKDNDFFLRKKDNKLYAHLDGKDYEVTERYKLLYRWRSYPELHYFFNNPTPIDFDLSKKSLEFSSKQLQEFKDNDLFAKLLTMDTQKSMLMFIFMLVILNFILSMVIFAKQMGWLDKK